METNQQTYSSKSIVDYYDKYESLQKPEQTIFNLLKDALKGMKMLDIGIGAGRTTRYFGPFVKEYVGIDYAKGMVEACKKKFGTQFPKYLFQEEDVRKLELYKTGEFDFVLFSFNGIDYMNAEERLLALAQIRRVLKPGGFFCFSTHNIQALNDDSGFEFRLNLLALVKQMIVKRKVKKINKAELGKVSTGEFVCINDGAHNFKLTTIYFRPSAQKKILEKAGFKETEFFSLETGLKVNDSEIGSNTDRWVYFLCK